MRSTSPRAPLQSQPHSTAFADRAMERIRSRDVSGRGPGGDAFRTPMLPIPYALDAVNFLSADVRNLFGPFINVFLVTSRHWSQTDVGLVTTASGLLGIMLQTPIGAAIDVTRAKRGVICLTMAAMTVGRRDHFRRSDLLADGDRPQHPGARRRRLRAGSLGADPRPCRRRTSSPAGSAGIRPSTTAATSPLRCSLARSATPSRSAPSFSWFPSSRA